MYPPQETTAEELQLLDRQKTNNLVGLDRDVSLTTAPDLPRRPAPTWEEVVDAGIRGQVIGYELGFQAGLREAADELDAQILRDRAAAVVRGVVSDRARAWARAGQPQRKGAAA